MSGQKKNFQHMFFLVTFLGGFLQHSLGHADVFELSGEFSYSRKNYSEKNYSKNSLWSLGLSYHFSEVSGVEVSYTDSYDKTVVGGLHTTLTDDSVFSLGWVQHFGTRESQIRPFFKLGVAQVYRKLERRYDEGILLTVKESSLSGYLALGMRVLVTDRLGLTLQGVSYLSELKLVTWSDNLSVRVGLSYYF